MLSLTDWVWRPHFTEFRRSVVTAMRRVHMQSGKAEAHAGSIGLANLLNLQRIDSFPFAPGRMTLCEKHEVEAQTKEEAEFLKRSLHKSFLW
ncbi:hypothetical protein DYB28_004573 [Aphanomyces astaci]|uniref:Uncharacterized protein n=1 Tax=Aphanomyces astaci TaxID=112090 RepID=A0A9X8DPB8_APHAT|nr:hypothetical protein DYB28_004573 [Aphanomyces astaci]